jgi:archaellum component FlaG (FlaF/FlaG flagellin family)
MDTMIGPLVALCLYVAVILFCLWLAYTLVRAVERMSDAMERASSTLAEMARNQTSR